MKIILLLLVHTFYASSLKEDNSSYKTADGPTITLLEIYCLIQEDTVIDYPNNLQNSECRFKIHDSNAQLGSIDFKIEDPEQQDIFVFKYAETPKDYETEGLVFLITKKKLYYDENKTYTVTVTMKDKVGATQTTTVTVNVYKPPIWSVIPSVLKIKEEEESFFEISATVGDGHPQVELEYMLLDEDHLHYATIERPDLDGTIYINPQTGLIAITRLDRERGITNFTQDVVVLYDAFRGNAATYGHILVLLDDIDDNDPIIDFHPEEQKNKTHQISLQQNATSTSIILKVVDVDAGINSEYSPFIKVPNQVKEAFEVSPKKGSGTTSFSFKINNEKIDYNDPLMKEFIIEVGAEGVINNSRKDSLSFQINLMPYTGTSSVVMSTTWMVLFSIFLSVFNTVKV